MEEPEGKKRAALKAWFASNEGPQSLFAGRILPFEEKAALIWGQLMAEAKAGGRPQSALDTIVAAIVQANGCVIVTDNERDFHGIEIINPPSRKCDLKQLPVKLLNQREPSPLNISNAW